MSLTYVPIRLHINVYLVHGTQTSRITALRLTLTKEPHHRTGSNLVDGGRELHDRQENMRLTLRGPEASMWSKGSCYSRVAKSVHRT